MTLTVLLIQISARKMLESTKVNLHTTTAFLPIPYLSQIAVVFSRAFVIAN